MCKENCTEINLSSSVFNEMRDNFDAILKKALGNIVKGKSGQADINLKLTISATGENEGQLKPKFKHQVSSVKHAQESTKVQGVQPPAGGEQEHHVRGR